MSRQIGLDTICLRPTPRFAHTEYSMGYHKSLQESLPARLDDVWEFDFQWCTNDGPVNWLQAGRATDMGHAVYAADGSDEHQSAPSPFTDVEEIYAFDPRQEYGFPGHAEMVRFYEDWYQKAQAANPHQVLTGGYYKTIISGALQSFGWDMLLMAGADEARFAKVLERFAAYTSLYAKAWADTSIDVYIQHDDIVWTSGPFMHPDFYRQAIIPHYRKMWAPLKQAGKKILFCSDGLFDMFMEDIAACGADGFIFEPCNPLEGVVAKFGQTHCLVGSKVDCRTMAFGTWEQVKAEMDATAALARNCAGFMWAVGNHIPANVTDAICTRYMDYLRSIWNRE